MGGALDWTALPVIAEITGAADIETLIAQLVAIRNWQQENRD